MHESVDLLFETLYFFSLLFLFTEGGLYFHSPECVRGDS